MNNWYDSAVFYHMYPLGMSGAPLQNKEGEVVHRFDELKKWLNVEGEMVAAIALGYTDREIQPLPRKPLSETVIYRGEYPAEE